MRSEPKRTEGIHLGMGPLSHPDAEDAMLRNIFFEALDKLVPECRLALLPIFERWRYVVYFGNPGDRNWLHIRFQLRAWARRWWLVGPKLRPLDWAVSVGEETLRFWQAMGRVMPGFNLIGWGGVVPGKEERRLCDGKYEVDPTFNGMAAWKLKEKRGGRFKAEYDALLRRYRDAGFVKTKRLDEPWCMELVVRHQVMGESRAIGDPSARRLKARLGLSRPRGRPRGRSRRG